MILKQILYNLKNNSENIAYRNQSEIFTFSKLYQYVKSMYNYLCKENKEKKAIIIYGHKSIYMIASFLACSFSGIAYIPVDKSIPIKRLEAIIKQVNPKYTFCFENVKLNYKNVIYKDKLEEIFSKKCRNEIIPRLKINDIYYIIFTSGSTGETKGVEVTYKNLNSFVSWFQNITVKEKNIILNQALFSFDLSVADLYLALTTGSELVILEKSVQDDFPKLFKELEKSKANIAVMTPSFAEILTIDKSFNEKLMPNLNMIYFCGETLLVKTAQKLFERFPNIKIINSYGPTECTVAITSINITKDMLELKSLPVGIAKENAQIYIIDNNLKVLSEGKVGEILIAGESVAKGYVGVKSNKFIIFKRKKGYLTGDIGYLENNMLYYKGRKDNQVKYKGYRIELGDIEEQLYKLEYVNIAVVIAKKDDLDKVQRIIAYIKLKESYSKNNVEIKKDLTRFLPEYMCPIIKIVDQIPINANGKIDRQKLKEI